MTKLEKAFRDSSTVDGTSLKDLRKRNRIHSRMHDEYDADRWEREFSLEKMRAQARAKAQNNVDPELAFRSFSPGGVGITGPIDLAAVAQLRSEILGKPCASDSVPVDLFVFCNGEPDSRPVTKLGGIPFRDRRSPWPLDDGDPLSFLAQLQFTDSGDLVPSLPGDLLLLFAPFVRDSWQSDGWQYNDDGSCVLYHEWIDSSSVEPVSAQAIPNDAGSFAPCYGQRHRSYDLKMDPFECDDERVHSPYLLPRFHGTKIGGLPFWPQEPVTPRGVFIGSIGSIHPLRKEYPFVNCPRALWTWEDPPSPEFVMIGDCGVLNLFFDVENGSLCAYRQW